MPSDAWGGDRGESAPPPTGPAHVVPGEAGDPVDSQRLRYQELFEFALDCLLLSDFKGVVLAANIAAAMHFQVAKDFLIGKPLGLFIVAGRRSRFYQCLIRLNKDVLADEFETQTSARGVLRDIVLRAEVTSGDRGNSIIRWAIRDVTERNRSESMRSDLIRRLMDAQEDERRRLSRELHDTMGQELTGLMLSLKAVESLIPESSPARARLRDMRDSVERLGRAAHETSLELRPSSLDDLGLEAAIVGLVRRWSQRSGVPVDLHVIPDGLEHLSREVKTAVYRVLQEALTNVAKHAAASRVSVIVERRDGHLVAIIEDDGRGFAQNEEARRDRLGIVGMRERVMLVGGAIWVESSPGVGTTIRIKIPGEGNERE
jgi:signal transduction histidine kinase